MTGQQTPRLALVQLVSEQTMQNLLSFLAINPARVIHLPLQPWPPDEV